MCTVRAEALGATIVGEFVDFGSGLGTERPGMRALIAKLAELHSATGRLRTYVIAADHARIGRSVEAYSRLSWEIEQAGAWLNIASIALAEYEALARSQSAPQHGWPPPEIEPNGGNNG
jgi:DNA invertase Pin-like site-specific DNA recombinase